MFFPFGGGKIVDRVADEIGIDRAVFKTALTEDGVNFAHYKIQLKAAEQMFSTEKERFLFLATGSLRPAVRGLTKLAGKFPGQPEIAQAAKAISYFSELHGIDLEYT